MSQNDFNLANQGFPSMRSDMNSALQALASNSSGATAPTTTYPYQWWYDETTDILKVRDAANAAWIDFATFNQGAGSWSFTSVDINGGTIDGTVIGGTTAAAISGTTGAFSGNLTVGGTIGGTVVADQAEAEAGTDNTKVMTPLRVAQAFDASEQQVGVGQTWQAVTRAKGTTYQNTTGKPIQVFIQGDNYSFQVSLDASTWLGMTGSGGSGFDRPTFAVVPDGIYYRATNDGAGALIWAELR